MFQCVDAEPVAIRQSDPVLVAGGERAENIAPAGDRVIEIEIAQIDKVAAFMLRVGVVDVAGAETAAAGAHVIVRTLKFDRPGSILVPADPRSAVSLRVVPIAEWMAAGCIADGIAVIGAAGGVSRIAPVRPRVIEDVVEQDANAAAMGTFDQIDPRAEPRIDVEKVLDPIAMISVEGGRAA